MGRGQTPAAWHLYLFLNSPVALAHPLRKSHHSCLKKIDESGTQMLPGSSLWAANSSRRPVDGGKKLGNISANLICSREDGRVPAVLPKAVGRVVRVATTTHSSNRYRTRSPTTHLKIPRQGGLDGDDPLRSRRGTCASPTAAAEFLRRRVKLLIPCWYLRP